MIDKVNDIKIILLVRNPIEVINSWVNAPKNLIKLEYRRTTN